MAGVLRAIVDAFVADELLEQFGGGVGEFTYAAP
jgi:hypothetical protein